MATQQFSVYDKRGKFTTLKVGSGGNIYLGSSATKYKVGGDKNIYTRNGAFVSKDGLLPAMKAAGVISKYGMLLREIAPSGAFLFKK